jgi:hypothetical protein
LTLPAHPAYAERMPIELIPLATATITLTEPIMLPRTPAGTRIIIEMRESQWEGERFRARQRGPAADWLTIGPDGTGTVDVRVTLETDDGATVFVRYTGRLDTSKGIGAAPSYVAPVFETGSDRYAWLNKIQAIAKGAVEPSRVVYEVYEVR